MGKFIAFVGVWLACVVGVLASERLTVPMRGTDAITGSEFVDLVSGLSVDEREQVIYEQVTSGNLPESLATAVEITERLADANGVMHSVTIRVLPDYLSIGSDEDFIRIPMLPETAQRIASKLGASLPTRKISDMIHSNAIVKFSPQPMTPDATMTTLPIFVEHNKLVSEQFIGFDEPLGVLVAGDKKDIVITNRLAETPQRLYIYGWHYTSGAAIQPLSGAHGKSYVDYSHGVRLVSREVIVDDDVTMDIQTILKDDLLYKLLSDESGAMDYVEYSYIASVAPALSVRDFVNYPNPACEVTNIDFSICEAGRVNLSLCNLSGNVLSVICDGWRDAGEYSECVDLSELPSGVYLFRLSAGGKESVIKCIVNNE